MDRRPETIAFRKKRRVLQIDRRIEYLLRAIVESKNSVSLCLVDHNGGICPDVDRIDQIRMNRIKDMEEEIEKLREEKLKISLDKMVQSKDERETL